MKYRVVNKQRLISIIDPEDIVSILEVSTDYGNSLAIAVRNSIDTYNLECRLYGDFHRGRIIYLPMDKFTYHIPRCIALPRNLWDSIIVTHKRAFHDYATLEANIIAGEFVKVSITKKVVW